MEYRSELPKNAPYTLGDIYIPYARVSFWYAINACKDELILVLSLMVINTQNMGCFVWYESLKLCVANDWKSVA